MGDECGEHVLCGRLGDTFRVLAAYSNTVVTISGIVVTNSNGSYGGTNYAVVTTNRDAGQFYETILLGPAQFQSTKPFKLLSLAMDTNSIIRLISMETPVKSCCLQLVVI